MWTDSTKKIPYTMLPFDENGVAYFDVKPNAADEDKIVIKGIPENCTYIVEEVDLTTGYTRFTSNNPSGTIKGNVTSTAEIENRIDVTNLTLTKEIELYKKTTEDGEFTKITDTSDPDHQEWAAEDFTFTVTFQNLVMGQDYTYTVNGAEQPDKITGNSKSAETVKTITVKGGQKVVFKDIPIGTKYTIEEISEFEDTDAVTYKTLINSDTENARSTGEQTLSADDEVTFTNEKYIDMTLIPEYVEVTIFKKWYSQDGLEVQWLRNKDGKAVKFRYDEAEKTYVEDDDKGAYIPYTTTDGGATKKYLTNYPSFLKVYLGRALAVPRKEIENGIEVTKYTYLDVVPGYTSDSLNVKGNWSGTFSDLEKDGEVIEYDPVTEKYEKKKYEYVYFVSEVVPVGFSNVTGVTNDKIPDEPKDVKTEIGSDKFFVATGEDNKLDFTLKNKEDETCELSVCKLVTGNFGNKSKDFTFEIEFTKSDGYALVGTGFTMQFTDLYDSTYVRNRTYTLEAGKVSVDLPHGKKVTFLSLPKGISYTITEVNGDGYAIHSGIYTGDPKSVNSTALTGGKEQTGTLTESVSYLYLNERQGSVPTGINLSLAAPIAAATLIFGYFVFYYIKRRRKQCR